MADDDLAALERAEREAWDAYRDADHAKRPDLFHTWVLARNRVTNYFNSLPHLARRDG